MLFNSFEFFLFFIVVTLLYFQLPHRYRWILLLTASCIFYMFFIPAYILILAFTITIDYFAGILIERASGRRRKHWLILSICANVGVLAFFKYYNFLNDNLARVFGVFGGENPIPYLDIILPIGLSFHTFQALSYTIEVYRGRQHAERHFGIWAVYVMFYPQLVAGPIERPQNLLHQFREKHSFNYSRFFDGLKMMAWGLFKKVCVADRLSGMVDSVYSNPGDHYGLAIIFATIFFSFQVYCDFSGYSEMAIGAARIMGFTLMKNFNCPFFSENLKDLWDRWHISLSTWFRDYIYFSLGGNRVEPWRRYANLMFTFTLSGLWHGANWGFVIWGFQQGVYLAIAAWTRESREKFNERFGILRRTFVWRLWHMLIVFMLFSSGLVFFRAADINFAISLFGQIFSAWQPQSLTEALNVHATGFATALAMLVLMLAVEWNLRDRYIFHFLNRLPVWLRWGFMLMLVLVILNLGVFDGTNFIYFQF